MSFDNATRNRLLQWVSSARTLLSNEFTRQLQQRYGLDPSSGNVTPLEHLTHLSNQEYETARILRETLKHYQVLNPQSKTQDLMLRILHEQAFTVFNRLAAIKLAEMRGFLAESIGQGFESKGFQVYSRLLGSALGQTGEAYRVYLFSLFDELAVDLYALFERYSPQGRIFPRETALLELLSQINDPELDFIWQEDETIGWIYQYFNSIEERRAMRKASQAPRNSRELAVRNQFFTPRYVVEFLTDNTLGRLWYAMTQGETALADSCSYLVLQPGEEFKRTPKDPRDIRLLDPACGSMHFGLYAFDLFEQIYREAWEIEKRKGIDTLERPHGMPALTELWPEKNQFEREIPRLIIEHNIHGVDIDHRATQIAALSLWLRAQRAWQNQNVVVSERPAVQHSQIVCAEPMPGEQDMLNEWLARTDDELSAKLVRLIFKQMQMASEAGSLLQIEKDIQEHIRKYKKDWPGFLADLNPRQWQELEQNALKVLRDYSGLVSQQQAYQARLFQQDAERGFAFLELSRKSFDVVLMNPPFGDISKPAKAYITKTYPRTKSDLYAAFVERGLDKLRSGGHLGAITSRTGFFLTTFKKWREEILLRESKLTVMADLGAGVLDTAMVETAAYCLEKN